MATYLLAGEMTERLCFRKLQESDFGSWLPFFQDPDLPDYWSFKTSDPELACRSFFQRMFHRYENDLGGLNAICLRSSGELVGLAGLLVQEIKGKTELEVAYSLLPNYRGMGYATEAASHCTAVAFRSGWARELISTIHKENHPSMKVARRNGFVADDSLRYEGDPVLIFRKNIRDDRS